MRHSTILLVILAATSVAARADLSVSVHSRQAVLVAQDIRFDAAVQPLAGIGAGVGLSAAERWFVTAGFAVEQITEAMTPSGVIYRAVAVRSMWGSIAWYAEAFGVEIGATGALSSYLLGDRLFAYLELTVAPLVPVRLGRWLRLEVSLPVGWQFRDDLVLAATAGLRVELITTLRRLDRTGSVP